MKGLPTQPLVVSGVDHSPEDWFLYAEPGSTLIKHIPHNEKAMAVSHDGDAAQKTCAYGPSENTSPVREGVASELGQAEAQRPSVRHDGLTHRSLAKCVAPGELSAAPVNSLKKEIERDPLATSRGILNALIFGSLLWTAIIALLVLLRR